MAEVEKTVVKYTIVLSQREYEAMIGALEVVSDSEIPGSYDLWTSLKQGR